MYIIISHLVVQGFGPAVSRHSHLYSLHHIILYYNANYITVAQHEYRMNCEQFYLPRKYIPFQMKIGTQK